ncbi:hypothetical protein [Streptomyces scabiei]|uniref:hypothetical protein n=1 Tax=Streptomyces scabiei TaxID=1930 RepID=UPI0029B7C4F0|nr:hypothetical protein [Streptomyces scabiei]MDX3520087.1 hypothetical protein [Streptomyces scabiei]
MSVDLVGTTHTPVPLDGLVLAAEETLARLLGLTAAPVLDVIADRRIEQGRVVEPGRRLSRRERGTELIGERVGGSELIAERVGGSDDERTGARDLDFLVAGYEDIVRLLVFDPDEVPAQEGHVAADGQREPVEAVFSPSRTCVGVVTATALALAVADLGGGEFVDAEIRMLPSREPHPGRMIERTGLPDRGDDFTARCARFMRQFARLNDWPRTVRQPPGRQAAP